MVQGNVQGPLPPNSEKPAYSRPASRPASASSCRDASFSRPSSAGAWKSVPSRPASAGSSRYIQARPESARSLQSQWAAGDSSSPHCRMPARPASAGSMGKVQRESQALALELALSASAGGLETTRWALEEELREPILTPVPLSLATPLEKEVATAIGIKGKKDSPQIPRLPRDVEACKQGSRCCWRWLARAALEEVSGQSFQMVSLGDAVSRLKVELVGLRQERGQAETQRMRAQQADDELVVLRDALAHAQRDAKDFRGLERETGRLQEESAELRATNGRLEAQLDAHRTHNEKLVAEMRSAVDAETAVLRARLEEVEKQLAKARLSEEELHRQILEREKSVRSTRSPTDPRNKIVDETEKRRQRAARRAAMKRRAAARATGRPRSK
eukprot:TRINITY_DN34566_c0_g1_i1.p1 TRINITY_DN34566_c0_g1~~TRINITY_DN34566_c0_g1_i1.p1  ORF type:complete len:389 (+),score=79.04 TRINITY_DN34566_c0_g1_i1:94-1260(+)